MEEWGEYRPEGNEVQMTRHKEAIRRVTYLPTAYAMAATHRMKDTIRTLMKK